MSAQKKLLNTRHNLTAAGLTVEQWRDKWDAARRVIAGNGETGKLGGNDTIRVLPSATPGEYVVQIRLPKHLGHLSNTPGPQAMYQISSRINWDARNRNKGSRSEKISEWYERIIGSEAVGYQLDYDTDTSRWVVTVAWTRTKKPRNKPDNVAGRSQQQTMQTVADDVAVSCYGKRCVGIDLNAGHIDAFILDEHGNPVGAPIFYKIPQEGSTEHTPHRYMRNIASPVP